MQLSNFWSDEKPVHSKKIFILLKLVKDIYLQYESKVW